MNQMLLPMPSTTGERERNHKERVRSREPCCSSSSKRRVTTAEMNDSRLNGGGMCLASDDRRKTVAGTSLFFLAPSASFLSLSFPLFSRREAV